MTLDTLVIGAGQAGLAAGYHLQRAGMNFLIVEASDQAGGSWSSYYDSLRLFSPARFSALPGLPFPADGDHYPTRDEVSAYLRQYASHFQLPIRTGMRVEHIEQSAQHFIVSFANGTQQTARSIIAATGAFSRPHIPQLPGQDLFGGQILHSASYRTPTDVQGQRVIVVGGGNSAVQIAFELAHSSRVSLATRHPLRFQAQQVRGKDIHWWWWLTGADRLPLSKRLRRAAQTQARSIVLDPGIYQAAISSGQIDQRMMFSTFTAAGVRWNAQHEEAIDSVIFATGYRPNVGYLRSLGALDAAGYPLHTAGISTVVPGLAYVGLEHQRTFASATLRGVGPDAARVVARLRQTLNSTQKRCCGQPRHADSTC